MQNPLQIFTHSLPLPFSPSSPPTPHDVALHCRMDWHSEWKQQKAHLFALPLQASLGDALREVQLAKATTQQRREEMERDEEKLRRLIERVRECKKAGSGGGRRNEGEKGVAADALLSDGKESGGDGGSNGGNVSRKEQLKRKVSRVTSSSSCNPVTSLPSLTFLLSCTAS